MFPIALQEPTRWVNLVVQLNDYMKYHDFLLKVVPITADIFVFLFPILLVILYIIWLIKNSDKIKESALRVFRSAIITSVINICIQFFFTKSRPTMMLFWHEEETMLHKFLPNSSFPSDHSAMSMWFAIWLLIRGIKTKNKITHDYELFSYYLQWLPDFQESWYEFTDLQIYLDDSL